MADDVRTSPDSDIVSSLGHEVYQIDTRMAGYHGITAGYLIRSERPCLVETGTAPSALVVRDALAGLGVGRDDLATVVARTFTWTTPAGSATSPRCSPAPMSWCMSAAPGTLPIRPG